jgi:hypothetical protein
MIELVANGGDLDNLVSITLTQDGDQVDINLDGELIAFFNVTEGKIRLELCERLDITEGFAERTSQPTQTNKENSYMAIVININSGKDFEPVSEGVHAAVLAAVVDKGIQPTAFGDKHKVMFVWLTDEADEDGKTKFVFQSFTASLHEKAGLRKAVKAIRGKDIDGQDFDIESLVGSQNQLVIQHNEAANGKVYANVSAILKAKPGTRVAIPSDFEFKPKAKEDSPVQPTNAAAVKAAGGGRAVAAAAYRPNTQADPVQDIGF